MKQLALQPVRKHPAWHSAHLETPVHCAMDIDKGYNLRLCWQYPVGQY